MRMKVTVVGYYDPRGGDYDGETDPDAMARIDAENTQDDPMGALMLCDDALPMTVTVEPVDA